MEDRKSGHLFSEENKETVLTGDTIIPKLTKRKFRNIMLVILSVALVITVIDSIYMISADSRFGRAAARGISAGWDRGITDSTLRQADGKPDVSFIDDELEAMKPYENAHFHSKKLSKLASAYIQALKDCKKAAAEGQSKDPEKFWEAFSEPYADRLVSIYRIYKGNYGLRFNQSKYHKQSKELILQGWALDKASRVELSRKDTKNGSYELYARLVNDSGSRLEFIDLTVELYDKKGNLIETASAYAENVKPGIVFYARCYVNDEVKARKYVVSAINCKAAD